MAARQERYSIPSVTCNRDESSIESKFKLSGAQLQHQAACMKMSTVTFLLHQGME